MEYLKVSDLQHTSFRKAFSVNESFLGSGIPVRRIFLSYSHADKEYVSRVVKWIQSKGIPVYIDYLDDELSEKSDVEAAKILRDRIQNSTKLMILSTSNTSNSKWIPWELGLGDGFMKYPNVVRLPLTHSGHWTNKNFFDIYGFVYKSTIPSNEGTWFIKYPDSNFGLVSLDNWLKY